MFYKILYLFMLFIVYSFIGWTIEIIVTYINQKKIINRGFLMGPYCPIYGFGAFILIYVMDEYKRNPVDLFMTFAVYASILEYLTSYLMEKLFNARWWDYSHMKFNVNGRICLINSLFFGLLGVAMGYFVNPLIMDLLNIIPIAIFNPIAIIIMILFIIDVIISFNVIAKIRKNIDSLNRDMTEDINKQVIKFIENTRVFKAFPLLNQKIHHIKDNK